MIDFSKAFPTETQNNIERMRHREATHAAHSPFGADEPEPLEKRVQHSFDENDRVVIHSPGHYHDGAHGKIVDARSDTRLGVQTDNGHTITASHSDLIPEALAPAEPVSEKILKRHPMLLEDDVLAKRARSNFTVGQRVIEKGKDGRSGEIVDITRTGLIEVKFGGGVGGYFSGDSLQAA